MRSSAAIVTSVVFIVGCIPSLPPRPTSLEAQGVRVGAGWLERTVQHEDSRLGDINQILSRKTGELVIIGNRAALFLPAQPKDPRIVEFGRHFGEVELLEWPGGSVRFLDRGGGGWQTGALLGADGQLLWQPNAGYGMNDMAAGDIDADGEPEFAVGYNGGGGVHLLDSSGRTRWRESDGNVWHVEIVDTDGDGRPEIVHSNAGGQVTVRDTNGKVRRRFSTEGYFSQFSLVLWRTEQSRLLHASDGVTSVVDFDGQVISRFETADTDSLWDAHGVPIRLGGTHHLVLVVSQSNWDRTQLFVFDEGGVLHYREVLAGECTALGVTGGEEFLFGCEGRVYRYARGTRPQG